MRRSTDEMEKLSVRDLYNALLVSKQFYWSARRRIYDDLYITSLSGQRWSNSVVNDTKKQVFLQTFLTGV